MFFFVVFYAFTTYDTHKYNKWRLSVLCTSRNINILHYLQKKQKKIIK